MSACLFLTCVPQSCSLRCRYVFDADVNDARVVTVPRKEGFKVDIEGIKWVPVVQHPSTFP